MNLRSVFLSLSTILLCTTVFSQAQTTFNSSCGSYAVTVSLLPVQIVPSAGNNCDWGYNYNLRFDYQVTVTGSIPNGSCGGAPGGNLFTLQALFTCLGSNSNGSYNLPLNAGSGTLTTTTSPYVPNNGTMNGYNSPYVNCSVATPQNFNCNSVNIIISGPGINTTASIPITYPVVNPNPLPIELIDFTGTKHNSNLELDWSTASERSNDYFTLEHSIDGINFELIDRVKGAGTTNEHQDYSYPNAIMLIGLNYYRLSQTDFDGTKKVLKIIAIENDQSMLYSLYPNPSVDKNVNLRVQSTSKLPITYRIYSIYGQLLVSEKVSSLDDVNQIQLPNEGSQFILELEQDSKIIGREKLFAL